MKASLTLLGDSPSDYSVEISAVDPERIYLAGAPILPLGSPIRVCEHDRLWLGEVVECGADGRVVAAICHALSGTGALARLAERFLGGQHDQTPTLS